MLKFVILGVASLAFEKTDAAGGSASGDSVGRQNIPDPQSKFF